MNNPSVLVVPTNMGRAVGVAAGTAHAAALMADGSVRMWGSILGSTTNTPSNVSSLVHVAASVHQLAGIRANGTCVGWGGIGRATVPPSAVNVVSLALSPRHMVFTRTDGRVFSASSSITGALIPPATATNIVRVGGEALPAALRTFCLDWVWASVLSLAANTAPPLSRAPAAL
jgi:alpha-tubulin suppressor-like RCC1 family protein